MRLLVVNVNTTTSMTDQIAARRGRLLRLAPRSSGSPLHWHWERSSTWPWPGDDCHSSPAERVGRDQATEPPRAGRDTVGQPTR